MNSLFLSIQSYLGKGDSYSGEPIRSCEEVIANDKRLDGFFGLYEPEETKDYDTDLTYSDGRVSDQGLYTSYLDYHQMFNDLEKKDLTSFTDIGCGIGRGLLLSNFENRSFQTYGIEVVSERVDILKNSLNRFPGNSKAIESCVISSPVSIPETQAYYLYIPDGRLLYSVMKQLREYAKNNKIHIYAVESHGSAIEEMKLWGVEEVYSPLRCSAYREFPEIKILELTTESKPNHQYFALYNQVHQQEGHVTIEENRPSGPIRWVGDLEGSKFYFINSTPYLELSFPNRTIDLSHCSFSLDSDFSMDQFEAARLAGKRLIIEPEIRFE